MSEESRSTRQSDDAATSEFLERTCDRTMRQERARDLHPHGVLCVSVKRGAVEGWDEARDRPGNPRWFTRPGEKARYATLEIAQTRKLDGLRDIGLKRAVRLA